MTQDNNFDWLDTLSDEDFSRLINDPKYLENHEETIEMKCIHCGHEERIPAFAYNEEADILADEGDTSLPAFQCPKCLRYTLYRKDQYSKLRSNNH